MKSIIILSVCFTGFLISQISGYSSASYGFSTNPLYNYETLSDQLKQTYLEVTSAHTLGLSNLKIQYVGGSMIFNRFTHRNYYEHHLLTQFETKFGSTSRPRTDNDNGDESGFVDENDSAAIFFHTVFQVSARHDKKEFQEFDNYGLLSNNLFRINIGDGFVGSIDNTSEYHMYQYLRPYENVTDIFALSLENRTEREFRYGVVLSGGLKYFPNIKYDTTLFEETRSFFIQSVLDSNEVGIGKQKHWVYFTYLDSIESDKVLLKRPGTKTTYQFAFCGFIQQNWNDILFRAEIVYRINSRSSLLTLVQNSSTLALNEDLYNNVFNAHGPELHFLVNYMLPWDIQLSTNIALEKKIFETPANDLISGAVINNNREDTNTNFELYFSKFIQITEGFSIDISFTGNYLRNQSNDAYNDFSMAGYLLSLGCGF